MRLASSNVVSGIATGVLLASLSVGNCRAEPAAAVQEVARPVQLYRLAFSGDGSLLIAGGDAIRIFSVDSGAAVRRIPAARLSRGPAVFPGRENLFAEAGDDGVIRLWRASEKEAIRELKGHTGLVRSTAISPDGKLLASTGGKLDDGTLVQGEVRLWNAATGAIVRDLKFKEIDVGCVAFSRDGKSLAFVNDSRNRGIPSTVDVYDLADWKRVRSISFRPGFARSVFFAGANQELTIVGGDCTPVDGGCRTVGKIWLAPPGVAVADELEQDREYGYFVACLTPAGDRLVLGTSTVTATFSKKGKVDGARLGPLVQLRDATTGETLWSVMTEGAGDPEGIAVSPDGKLIAMALDQTIHIFDSATGEILREIVVKE